MTTSAPRPRGAATHPCPHCGGLTRVLKTARAGGPDVYRLRTCVGCGRRTTTVEIGVPADSVPPRLYATFGMRRLRLARGLSCGE